MYFLLLHRRATPSFKVASNRLYTRVEKRDTVRVKCLAQEQNTMSPARVEPRPLDLGPQHLPETLLTGVDYFSLDWNYHCRRLQTGSSTEFWNKSSVILLCCSQAAARKG